MECDVAQGDYFARPQPRELVDVLVKHPFCWRTIPFGAGRTAWVGS
jgi:hypothetical protein